MFPKSGKAGQTKFTVPELKFCSLTTVLSHGIQAFSTSLYLYRSFCIKPGACMLHAIAIQLAHYNFTVLVCAEWCSGTMKHYTRHTYITLCIYTLHYITTIVLVLLFKDNMHACHSLIIV